MTPSCLHWSLSSFPSSQIVHVANAVLLIRDGDFDRLSPGERVCKSPGDYQLEQKSCCPISPLSLSFALVEQVRVGVARGGCRV